MEKKGRSAATELPTCNCGKSGAVQISTTEKKKNPDQRFWGCEGRNLYENKNTRIQYLKIKVQ